MLEGEMKWRCGRCNAEYIRPASPRGWDCPDCKSKGIKHAYLHCEHVPIFSDESLDHRIRGD